VEPRFFLFESRRHNETISADHMRRRECLVAMIRLLVTLSFSQCM
jgi:hypothetical protein